MDTLKMCRHCGLQKPLDQFGKNQDRFRQECKTCVNEKKAARKRRGRERQRRYAASLAADPVKNARRVGQKQLASTKYERTRRYRRWLRNEMKDLRRTVERQQARAALLEYRSWWPVEPRLSVKNWDRTHDVIHGDRLFLVDHVVVERLVKGLPVGEAGYNKAELHMAILRLHSLGYPGGRIAQRVGLKDGDAAGHILRHEFGLLLPENDPREAYQERGLW